MGAINIERGETNRTCKDETWKREAFLAVYRRLSWAVTFSLFLPFLSLLVIICTPAICLELGATRPRDWIRMGLSLGPHALLSTFLIHCTLPGFRRPSAYKILWQLLSVHVKVMAKGALYLFVLVSALTFMDLYNISDATKENCAWSEDQCRRIVGILVNWISSFLLNLLIVRVNCDQTRASLSLEALDILKWNGGTDGECDVEVTDAVKKSYRGQMVKIYDFLCVGTTVMEMAYVYTTIIAAVYLSVAGVAFYYFYTNVRREDLYCCLVYTILFLLARMAMSEAEDKKTSFGIFIIFWLQVFWTGAGAHYLYHYEPNPKEFVLRSMRYWNGDSQPASVPGTMWAGESAINDPHLMATMSLYVMAGAFLALFLLHSIYTFFFCGINPSPADSASLEEPVDLLA